MAGAETRENRMSERVDRAGLDVSATLANFVETEALAGLDVSAEAFWSGFADLLADFAPRNAARLAKRAELQDQIDAWHRKAPGQETDPEANQAYLRENG